MNQTATSKKKISIGISDFKELIEKGCYYIDKTRLIEELLDDYSKVLLLPRPRRFGKTLNLSMLRYFFEKNEASQRHLFEGLAIAENAGCMEHQGRYPVILINFKDIQENNNADFLHKIAHLLSKEYQKHPYLLEDDHLQQHEKEVFLNILHKKGTPLDLKDSLLSLTEYLHRYHQQRPIVLIDEYDSPIHAAFDNNYYKEAVDFFRGFLGAALKDNPNLERAVLTGILRISKESIFSELNHIKVCSLLRSAFSTHFGLLETEVKAMLKYFGMEDRFDAVSEWYNGYQFGGNTIYNPWSVINYIDTGNPTPSPFWVNTSSNELIHRLLRKNFSLLKSDLEALLGGETLAFPIDENTIFSKIENSKHHLWSFLVFTGYLKASNGRLIGLDQVWDLEIPNFELKRVFTVSILDWIHEGIGSERLNLLLRHLTRGEIDEFVLYLRDLIETTVRVYDTRRDYVEIAYHMFVLGLMVNLEGRYHIRSNRESGLGRYDLALEPKNPIENGFLFEFKRFGLEAPSGPEAVQASLEEALQQIEEKKYHTELQARGIQRIYCVSLVFTGKSIYHLWRLMDISGKESTEMV